MKIINKILVILFCANVFIFAQSHFPRIEETGESYHIVVTNVTANDSPIVGNSEIAVFDDTLCVGVAIFEGTYNLVITAWEASDIVGLPGFRIGDPMTFKLWTEVNSEWVELNATADYEVGDGNFGTGAYSVVSLTSNISGIEEDNKLSNFKINIYPNPGCGKINFNVSSNSQERYTIGIYNLLGELIYSFDNGNGKIENVNYSWNGISNGEKKVSSGIYLLIIKAEKHFYSGKFLFVK